MFDEATLLDKESSLPNLSRDMGSRVLATKTAEDVHVQLRARLPIPQPPMTKMSEV